MKATLSAVTKRERILLFGGTFDPPHRAHIELPAMVAARAGCDRIIYVPARINPLKSAQPTPGEDRVAMLKAALADQRDAEISTIELDREGPSYFVDTLEAFRRRIPGAQFMFLIGCDQAIEFHRWREWERILSLAQPVVMLRPPWTRESLRDAIAKSQGEERAAWWLAHLADASLPLVDGSATEIRERLRRGEAIDDLVTPAVAEYIRAHGLYA